MDYSTDDESVKFFFSETDQSGGCSEITSRRSSYDSHNDISDKGVEEEKMGKDKSKSMEDLRIRIKSHKRLLLQHQSVSLDYTQSGNMEPQ